MRSQVLDILKQFLVRYGLVAGTAILLISWVVENYLAAHWDQKAADLGELRTHTFQELILDPLSLIHADTQL